MPETPHPEDEPLRSTVQDLEEFKNSRVWHDMKRLLNNRMEIIKEEMKDPELTIERLRRLQGRMENVESMLDLPDKFLQEVKSYSNE